MRRERDKSADFYRHERFELACEIGALKSPPTVTDYPSILYFTAFLDPPSLTAIGDTEDSDRRHVQPLFGQARAPPGRPELAQDGPAEKQRVSRPRQAHADELREEDADAPVQAWDETVSTFHSLLPQELLRLTSQNDQIRDWWGKSDEGINPLL
jgi:hypothetical protein